MNLFTSEYTKWLSIYFTFFLLNFYEINFALSNTFTAPTQEFRMSLTVHVYYYKTCY